MLPGMVVAQMVKIFKRNEESHPLWREGNQGDEGMCHHPDAKNGMMYEKVHVKN